MGIANFSYLSNKAALGRISSQLLLPNRILHDITHRSPNQRLKPLPPPPPAEKGTDVDLSLMSISTRNYEGLCKGLNDWLHLLEQSLLNQSEGVIQIRSTWFSGSDLFVYVL